MKKLFFLIILVSINTYSQTIEIVETYNDSIETNDGNKYLIKLSRTETKGQKFDKVKITFTIISDNKSTIIDTYTINKDKIIGCGPKLLDYNGDGNMDFSIISALAGRGSNQVRTLFIYDVISQRFIHIKNSESYPNISYNQHLKCLNSYAFHGGTSQHFLYIKSDSLIPTYCIDIYGKERILRKYENGKFRRIKIDSIENQGFPFYIDYNPYKEYTSE